MKPRCRRKVYKVIHKTSLGSFHSAIDDIRKSVFCTVYKPNQITKASVGRLFVFSNLADAQFFRRGNSNMEVWEAVGYNVKGMTIRLHCNRFGLWSREDIEKFWKAYDNKKSTANWCDSIRRTPEGTLGAKAIKLVKRVV